MATYWVAVQLRGEGYSERVVEVEIADEYRGGDTEAHHEAARREAIERQRAILGVEVVS